MGKCQSISSCRPSFHPGFHRWGFSVLAFGEIFTLAFGKMEFYSTGWEKHHCTDYLDHEVCFQ